MTSCGMLCLLVAVSSPTAKTASLLEHFLAVFGMAPSSVRSIARFDLDLDGDHKPEIFLGLPGNQYGQDWVAYKNDGRGVWRSLGAVRFHYKAFHYSVRERRLWAYVRVSENSGGYNQFRLRTSGFVEDPQGADDLDVEMKRSSSWNPPPLGWARVGALLAGNEVWRDLASDAEIPVIVKITALRAR